MYDDEELEGGVIEDTDDLGNDFTEPLGKTDSFRFDDEYEDEDPDKDH